LIWGVRAAAAAGLALAAIVAAPASVVAEEYYYWRWSDGSMKAARTFTQAEYGIASNLPHLIVTAEPALPRREVRLQFSSDVGWTTETTARTDTRGVARIRLDPTCAGGTWCDDTLRYQLLVGGQSSRLTITYSED
jgi:hypothetical protein